MLKPAQPLGKAVRIADTSETFGEEYGRPSDKVRQAQDDTNCYLYLRMGLRNGYDSPVGLKGLALFKWFETLWGDCYY